MLFRSSLIIGDDVKMANYVDTDGDGIPDVWEKANDMDWNDPSDGNYVNRSGYTNLELYLNSLVAHITRKQNDGGTVLEDTGSLNGSVSNAISNVLNDFKPCVYAANGKFFFENVEISSIIQIYNVNGVLIKAITAENSDFCINLPKGIHLVRITSSSKSKTFKVVNT